MSTFAPDAEAPPAVVRSLTPHAEGAGTDLALLVRKFEDLLMYYHASLAMTDRAELFRGLADEWRSETRFESSLERITSHPSYRAIVGLGEEAVPLILEELKRRPEPWFAALRELTQANPVRPEDRGDMRTMADAWLRWGRGRLLIR